MNPFDLPVHPIVVHFPVAMLTAGWICLLVRYALRDQRWAERAKTFETIGVATLPITVIAGFVDTRGFGFVSDVRWDQPLVWHVIVSLAAAVVYAGHWWWQRTSRSLTTRVVVADLAWVTFALWMLVLTGAIAGEMVYAA